jgi:hypothetical protein
MKVRDKGLGSRGGLEQDIMPYICMKVRERVWGPRGGLKQDSML